MFLNRVSRVANRSWRCPCSLALMLVLLSPSVFAQQPGVAAAEPTRLTIDQLETQVSRVQEAIDLNGTTKAELVEAYRAALEQLHLEEDWKKKADQFEEARQQAPDKVRELEEQLSQPLAQPQERIPEDATLAELNELLMTAEAELAAAVDQRVELDAEPARRAERRRQIPELFVGIARRLDEARVQIATGTEAASPLDPAYVRRLQAQARLQAMEAERDAYDKELRSYEARGKLLTLRQGVAVRRVTEKEAFAQALRKVVLAKRQEEALQAAAAADRALRLIGRAGPLGRDHAQVLANQNAALAERRVGPEGLLSKIQAASQAEQQLTKLLAAVKADFREVRDRAYAAQRTEAFGVLLRRHRGMLPDIKANRARIRQRNEVLAQAQFDELELQTRSGKLADIESVVSQTVREQLPGADEAQRQTAAEVFNELYTVQRDYVNALLDDYATYIDTLVRVQIAEQQLIGETEAFSTYIAEHVLWVRSGAAVGLRDFRDSWVAVLTAADTSKWFKAGKVLAADMRVTPVSYILVFLFLLLYLVGRRWFVRGVEQAGEQAGKASCIVLRPTLDTLVMSVFMASVGPALLGFLAWRLGVASTGDEFERALGSGMGRMAVVLLTFEFPRQMIRSGGLAERHFNWPIVSLKRIRRHVPWMMAVATFVVLLVSFLEAFSDGQYSESLGRLAFIVAMGSFVLFGHVLMRPLKGPIPTALDLGKRRGHARLQVIWYLLATCVPLALVLLACSGYYFTALRLSWRAYGTLLFALSLLTLRGVVFRWLKLIRRRLAMEQARQRREARKMQALEGTLAEKEIEEPEVELIQIDAQTQRLARSVLVLFLFIGLWLIWADVLPALRVFNEVELWHTTSEVVETAYDVEGAPQTTVRQELVPITLLQLGLAAIVAIMTIIFFRNLPGLLEFVVLSRLPLGPGERYAISSIVGYIVLTVGVILAFDLVGMGWSKVQWVVAAMGLGLGFGLQEIFANFISGLIILFERPIRVGDTVTIGNINGTVSKIRIRATRIVDWDRKELIVPNKEFVTGQLINWTLSDSILRLIIPVGVAYGSDMERVVRVLYDVAKDSPLVLEDPKPYVLFLEFGNSSLNLELRVYCPSVEVRYQAVHELHMAIDQAFRKEGIEIAFPQRDIHVRSIKAELPISKKPEKEDIG